ncbi:CRISPR-associated protein Cas8 [Porphyromonas gulae]|uniref:type I-PGING CRISPR-associated protein Cas8c/Csp2 n=1 Tax=Porphyromonas gulae TaxID=111105 RepID=UPI00036B574D|nr:type I-PGING CRISPR-associated protein Cas8c/Csp2 [Porphyromonas gulae]KGN78368.1 CRISPR-associated protein Cas8 [Porphyromonas gulae]
MNTKHFYIRYGCAITLYDNELSEREKITPKKLRFSIQKGLSAFRVEPQQSNFSESKIRFSFVKRKDENKKKGVFLSPHIITKDEQQASNVWAKTSEFLEIDYLGKDNEREHLLRIDKKNGKVSKSNIPIAGEYLTFGENDIIGRGSARISVEEQAYGMITTLTPLKPALQVGKNNFCIIPDIPLNQMVDFIALLDKMQMTHLSGEAMLGSIDNKGVFQCPKIFRGNFPNSPQSDRMGAIALLGAIGEFAKLAEFSTLAQKVLDSLKGATLYLITYGDAMPFTFHHYIIDLAKEGKLHSIVDSLFHSRLYKKGKRDNQKNNKEDPDYAPFDFFANRFLQSFNKAAFDDFFRFRVEYPNQIKILFQMFFTKMEKLKPDVIASAQALGSWLNQVAYFAAKEEADSRISPGNIFEEKAKFLVMMESSIFAAKRGDALIAQILILAGRLSKNEAPKEALLFMEKTITGEIDLSVAKNLLIAYMRIRREEKQRDLNSVKSDDTIPSDINIDDLTNT